MRCSVCRRNYATVHECPGTLYMGDVSKPDNGFLLGYYLGEALRIFKLDHMAIRRIEHDRRSIFFSIPIFYIILWISVLPGLIVEMARDSELDLLTLIVAAILALIYPVVCGIALLVQIGIGHGLARWFFGGQGSYVRLLRPYLFGSMLPAILGAVPIIGYYISGSGGLVIWMWIFEEVEGISRIQAFGIVFICIIFLLILMLPAIL